ncbi:MAG: ankyrin repeat domain-containing protein [Syntrophobacteraceae bacterium]|jgi:ankyrin repeat protein
MFGKKLAPVFGCICALHILIALGGCATEVLQGNVKDRNITELEENIKRGMDIDGKDRNGFAPLMVAAYYNHSEIVKYLCEKGANINTQDKDGRTAVMYAIEYGYDSTFNILIHHGADVNLLDKEGHNALWYAIHNKREEMCRILEDAGAK